MTTNAFNPMIPLLQGQQFEQGLSQAELEGLQLRERQALRAAARKLGSQNYFAGYEGVPGAERPDYIKEAWASADPAEAAKLEAMVAEPFKLERGVGIAGKTEEAKDTAKNNAIRAMIRGIRGDMGITTPNAMTDRLNGGGASVSGSEAPSSPAVGEPTAAAAPNLAGLSGTEEQMGITPQGFEYRLKTMPDITKQQGIEDIVSKKSATALNEKQYRQKAEQDLITNLRDTNNQIADQEAKLPLRQANPAFLRQLYQQRDQQRKALDDLATGKTPVVPPLVPAAPTPVPAPEKGPGLAPTVPAPVNATPVAPAKSQGPELNEYEKAALKSKAIEHDTAEKLTFANKEIDSARAHAMKIQESLPLIDKMFYLVTKHNIGQPMLEGIPLASNMMSINRENAQVHKLWSALTNIFIEKGQSSLMNTIVERTMTAAMVPSLFTEPQQNKELAATLKSNVTHLRNLPSFLERWKRDHNGDMDGADSTWINYVKENPIYTTKTNASGRVTVIENPHVKPITQWMQDTRTIGGVTYQRQPGGGWKRQ